MKTRSQRRADRDRLVRRWVRRLTGWGSMTEDAARTYAPIRLDAGKCTCRMCRGQRDGKRDRCARRSRPAVE